MPEMRVLGALLCMSIHLGSVEEKTGTWKHCSGSSHLPWRVCGSHCSSGKMLLAAAGTKPDQTGFPQKEMYHLTQAEVSDKRGSGQSLRALTSSHLWWSQLCRSAGLPLRLVEDSYSNSVSLFQTQYSPKEEEGTVCLSLLLS